MRRLLLLTPLLLIACANSDRVPIASMPPGSQCVQSGALDTFKGEVASADLATRVMMASRAPRLRWVPFGAIITMEFDSARVTVRLDQQNRVLSATCG